MKVNFKLCMISLILTTTYSQAITTEQYVIANKKTIASAHSRYKVEALKLYHLANCELMK